MRSSSAAGFGKFKVQLFGNSMMYSVSYNLYSDNANAIVCIVDTCCCLHSTHTHTHTSQKRKVRKMHIMKGTSGLGIRIVGGKGLKHGDMGIFVNQLEEGGAANR